MILHIQLISDKKDILRILKYRNIRSTVLYSAMYMYIIVYVGSIITVWVFFSLQLQHKHILQLLDTTTPANIANTTDHIANIAGHIEADQHTGQSAMEPLPSTPALSVTPMIGDVQTFTEAESSLVSYDYRCKAGNTSLISMIVE